MIFIYKLYLLKFKLLPNTISHPTYITEIVSSDIFDRMLIIDSIIFFLKKKKKVSQNLKNIYFFNEKINQNIHSN